MKNAMIIKNDNNELSINAVTKNNNALISAVNVNGTGNTMLDTIASVVATAGRTTHKMQLLTCVMLTFVKNNESKVLANTGFKDFRDYAKKVHNIEHAWAYRAVQICSKFITVSTADKSTPIEMIVENGENKLKIASLDNLIIDCLKDADGCEFGLSAMGKMVSLTDEQRKELIDSEKVDSISTLKEIEDAVKAVKAIETKADTNEQDGEQDGEQDSEQDGEQDKPLTDTDRLNIALEAVNTMENETLKNIVIKAINKAFAEMKKNA